jgi:hypothetical protein
MLEMQAEKEESTLFSNFKHSYSIMLIARFSVMRHARYVRISF